MVVPNAGVYDAHLDSLTIDAALMQLVDASSPMDLVAIGVLEGEFGGNQPLVDGLEEFYYRVGPYSNNARKSSQLINVMIAG
jgi:hypothetical protein